jgi:hypothetical protein
VQQSAWTVGANLEPWAPTERAMTSSLADTLLAIQRQRGTLFMLDMSRCLIEKWDLRRDRLQEQSEDTVRLVERLLKS